MNVEIGKVAAQFLFREYLYQNFGIGSLQFLQVIDTVSNLLYFRIIPFHLYSM